MRPLLRLFLVLLAGTCILLARWVERRPLPAAAHPTERGFSEAGKPGAHF